MPHSWRRLRQLRARSISGVARSSGHPSQKCDWVVAPVSATLCVCDQGVVVRADSVEAVRKVRKGEVPRWVGSLLRRRSRLLADSALAPNSGRYYPPVRRRWTVVNRTFAPLPTWERSVLTLQGPHCRESGVVVRGKRCVVCCGWVDRAASLRPITRQEHGGVTVMGKCLECGFRGDPRTPPAQPSPPHG